MIGSYRQGSYSTGSMLSARLDRLSVWSLSWSFIVIIGLGYLFTFFDIFDINVSFIQTCTQIKVDCTPENALQALPLPVLLNLAGYIIGALVFSAASDRSGRRNVLVVTMLVTGLGSLYTALAPDYVNFNVARLLTGIGIGGDLAIVNTYIGEVAPRNGRAKFTTIVFIMSALGAILGVWLGLLLTTGSTRWPFGLPFAVASVRFTSGWRWVYGIGAMLAAVAVVLRFELPESPRWLLGRGRLGEAEAVVTAMEQRAARRGPLAEPVVGAGDITSAYSRAPWRGLVGSSVYRRRVVLLLAIWFVADITIFSYGFGFTSVLVAMNYPPSEAGVVVAVGTFGFLAEAVVMSFVVEKLERQHWLAIGVAITFAGVVLLALAGGRIGYAFVGALLIFAGFNLWISPVYALTAESFPTRSRASGFALVEGVGHLGAAIGIFLIAPILPRLSILAALSLTSSFLVIAAILVQFLPRTRDRPLDEISP